MKPKKASSSRPATTARMDNATAAGQGVLQVLYRDVPAVAQHQACAQERQPIIMWRDTSSAHSSDSCVV